jgi:hypothetical protein
MFDKLHDKLFGDWREKSVATCGYLDIPGIYLMAARAFGLKGYLGGLHSWIVQVSASGVQTVVEITDLETLEYQGVKTHEHYREQPGYTERMVVKTSRDGFQRWFGAEPKILDFTPIGHDLDLSALCRCYPHLRDEFQLLDLNCNTFVSWVVYHLSLSGISLKFAKTFGTKNNKYWEKFYV